MTQTETHLDQFHGLSVDIPKRSVAIHLRMPESTTALLIPDEYCYHYLEKHSILLGEVNDLIALV